MDVKRYTSPMSDSMYLVLKGKMPNIVEIRDWMDFLANFCDANDGCPVKGHESVIWNDEPCPYYDECHDDCFIRERTNGKTPNEWEVTGGLISDSRYEDAEDMGYWLALKAEKKKSNTYLLTKTVLYKTAITGVTELDALRRAEAYDWVRDVITLRPWTVEETRPNEDDDEEDV